ncbi:porin family protein [Psychroserpens luteolus]|uniref:hypothetical protein n=1 Tax=Psychroserpens luteolus TaxID=2855840 RepID=UPI001E2E0115|nr:hypothetical protein [Psychroserpens luteolus]MCD2260429.1 hypothetical protein [Psychroserpens luteolus]
MKSIFSLTFILLIFNLTHAQTNFKIDVSGNVTDQEITIKAGAYHFSMTHVDVSKQYKLSAIKENMTIEKLETPEGFGVRGVAAGPNVEREIGTFDLLNGEQLTITIDVFDIGKDADGNRTETKTSTFKYIYKTKARGQWRTTFGFNFIYITKQDTYFSKDIGDDSYMITEGTNRKKFDYHPTLMFTWLPNSYIKGNKNWQFGLSGGIGYDFDSSLSVFLGPSIIYNENITVSIGGAFHNQKRLLSQYTKNQVLNENLTFDQLHDDYIRFNPFVSISFRLDKNPFKTD